MSTPQAPTGGGTPRQPGQRTDAAPSSMRDETSE